MQGYQAGAVSAPMRPYESWLGSSIYGGGQREKTFVDKTMARQDVDEIKDLMMKEDLSRQDLRKLQYLIGGIERKLENFTPYDRYLLGKFFTWIRDFESIIEGLLDFKEKLDEGTIPKTEYSEKMVENVRHKMLHNFLFLIDVFLYLSRSTLSINAEAFRTITSQRFEYAYSTPPMALAPEDRRQSLGLIFKK